jgi:hypothetical protein
MSEISILSDVDFKYLEKSILEKSVSGILSLGIYFSTS